MIPSDKNCFDQNLLRTFPLTKPYCCSKAAACLPSSDGALLMLLNTLHPLSFKQCQAPQLAEPIFLLCERAASSSWLCSTKCQPRSVNLQRSLRQGMEPGGWADGLCILWKKLWQTQTQAAAYSHSWEQLVTTGVFKMIHICIRSL